jgi:hypothetical protein
MIIASANDGDCASMTSPRFGSVSACGLLGAASLCFAQQQLGAGIHNGLTAQTTEAAVLPAGLTIRTDFMWKYMEDQTPGVLHFPGGYAQLDTLVTDLARQGKSPIVILDYGNPFYDGGDLVKSPAAIQAYTRYAAFVVNHFKGRVQQFEVWNEWNLNTSSKVQPHVWGDAASYVNLLRAAYPAIKAKNPDAVVIGGVVGGTDDAWIDKFIAAGGLSSLDVFSVHPYVWRKARRPNAPTLSWRRLLQELIPSARAATSSQIAGTPEDSIAWLDQLKARIDKAAPGRQIPVYVTEIGWPTSSGGGVSESVAAAYLQRFLLLAHTRAWIAGVWWYDLVDDGANATDSEARFGLLRQNGQPKPAYDALLKIKDFVETDTTAVQTLEANGEITVKGRTAGGTDFAATWLPTDDFARIQPSATIPSLLKSGYRAASPGSSDSTGAVPLLFVR